MHHRPRPSTLVLEALEEHDELSLGSEDATAYDFVDPDVLDRLFDRGGSPHVTLHVEVGDALVTVQKSGEEVRVSVIGHEE